MLAKLLLGTMVAVLLVSVAPATAAPAPYSALGPLCGGCADAAQGTAEASLTLADAQLGVAAVVWGFAQGIAGTFAGEAQETVDSTGEALAPLGQAVAHLQQVVSGASPEDVAREAEAGASHVSELARTCLAGPGAVTAAFASSQSGQDVASPWAGVRETCAALVP